MQSLPLAMATLSFQNASLQSTQLTYSLTLSGRMRKGCPREPSISYTRTLDKTSLRADSLLCVSRTTTKVPCFSTRHSKEGNLREKTLSKAELAQDEHAWLLKKRANEIVTDLRGTCIFLIGMMGSGKTTVGKLLADALGYHFFDSDRLIEEAAGGISVAQIFQEHSEEGFRDAETEVLKQLSCRGRLVVATGGGIVVRPINWSYLRHGVTVWLDVPLEALAERVVAVGTGSRPLLRHSVGDSAYTKALAKLSAIFKVRGPFYEDADTTVCLQDLAARLGHEDVSSLTPTMIALEALEEIDKLILLKKREDVTSAF